MAVQIEDEAACCPSIGPQLAEQNRGEERPDLSIVFRSAIPVS